MLRFLTVRLTGRWAAVALVAVAVLLMQSDSTRAAVNLTADPTLPLPTESAVFTVNPHVVLPNANRGVATTTGQGHRNLRQTFQLAEATSIGDIFFSLDVGNVNDGLQLRIYEVNDVQADWAPLGAPVKEFVIPTLIATNQWLQVSFTAGDVFTLPARATGVTGYGIEFADNQEIVGASAGLLYFTNGTTDNYAGGRYYSEGADFEFRDVGLIFVGTDAVACDLGDVNCDTSVNEVDLEIIAAHFRQSGGRELGDLTGNGFIDFDDFGQWKTAFSSGGGSLDGIDLSFVAVPEPSSILFAIAGLMLIPVRWARLTR
jgi:hypothetical protein